MTESPTGVPTCYRHPRTEAHVRCQHCDRPICPQCMRDASVGHQCPDCVRRGARETRANRGPYGGLRSANPALTSQVLIGINAVVWVAILASGGGASKLLTWLALSPGGACQAAEGGYYTTANSAVCALQPGATWIPGAAADGALWQLLTSAFTHVEYWHVGVNLLTLWFAGPRLEAIVGRARFLAIYLLSALAGSVTVLWLAAPSSVTLGASGAGFGMLGALALLAVKVRDARSRADDQFVLQWLGINVVTTVVLASYLSWQGHLGGLLGGAAVMAILAYAPKQRQGLVQGVGLAAVAVLLAGLVVARMLTLT